MEIKYAAVFASVQAGGESVTSVCDRLGISRKSYYKYLNRFRDEGVEGLRARSRRPLTSPKETPPEMVALIGKARADLATEGWDSGALSIFYQLLREGAEPPSWRTIHRVWCVRAWCRRSPGSGRVLPGIATSSPPPMIAGRLMPSAMCWPAGSR
jgi:transposase-like protein